MTYLKHAVLTLAAILLWKKLGLTNTWAVFFAVYIIIDEVHQNCAEILTDAIFHIGMEIIESGKQDIKDGG